MKTLFFPLLMLSVVFTSCLKEEDAKKRPDAGEAVTVSVAMGSNYKYQIWYDLGTESIIKTGLKTDWDLSLDSDAGENHIYVNSGKLMKAAKATGEFGNVTSEAGLNFIADYHDINPDSLAFSGWHVGDVYVVDRGTDENANPFGYIKFEITGYTNGVLSFRYAKLDGTDEHTGQITKNETYNVVAYSFTSHEQLFAEPPKDQWDLAFTQYTYIFYEPDYQPYLVTGVLGNANGVTIAVDDSSDFGAITFDEVANYTFSPAQDVIGYDWKYYDFDAGTYTVESDINFIIKDVGGEYYKLHFTDFYDNTGAKGAPKFEMQRL